MQLVQFGLVDDKTNQSNGKAFDRISARTVNCIIAHEPVHAMQASMLDERTELCVVALCNGMNVFLFQRLTIFPLTSKRSYESHESHVNGAMFRSRLNSHIAISKH